MSILCRTCAHPVVIDRKNNTACCANCNKELTRSETIDSLKLKVRMDQLKAMHELMLDANDENIYMSWIYFIPDHPIHEDFEGIALDDESYNECFDLFVKLIADEGNRW